MLFVWLYFCTEAVLINHSDYFCEIALQDVFTLRLYKNHHTHTIHIYTHNIEKHARHIHVRIIILSGLRPESLKQLYKLSIDS